MSAHSALAETETYSPGLEGIIVGQTAISNVEGDVGRLSYRGHDIEALVNEPFMKVVWLVLFGCEPKAGELAALDQFMLANGRLDNSEIQMLCALDRGLHPMLMLQALVPALKLEAKGEVPFEDSHARDGLLIAAKLPALIAAWFRLQQGKEPIEASDVTNFHGNFLACLHGEAPGEQAVRTLDATQILQMEHSYNAGTFAGRVCASTEAPIQSVISASIGTLYGRLHGGADQAALEMADAIGSADKAKAYVQDCIAKKIKIMGMGHREYKTVDPRAKVLKPMAAGLCTEGDAKRLFETLVAVEDACRESFAERGKDIWANVEFYKGAVFHALGLPPSYFTAMFAMARVYGYVAHFIEFSDSRRLIRPRAHYVGR